MMRASRAERSDGSNAAISRRARDALYTPPQNSIIDDDGVAHSAKPQKRESADMKYARLEKLM